MKADLELHRVIGRKVAPRDYGWGRPLDWPDVAPYEEGDEGFTGLAIIPEGGATLYIELIATTSGVMGQIDWGDGSALEDIVSDTQYSHAYTYSAAPGGIVPSVGAKIAKVIFTAAAGKSIREIYLTRSGTTDKSTVPWLDIHVAGPNIERLWPHFGMMTYLRVLQAITFYGSNKAGGVDFNFQTYPSLRYIKFNSSNAMGPTGYWNYVFSGLASLVRVSIDWYIRSTDIGSFFSGDTNLLEAPPINAPNATFAANLFYNCYSLIKTGIISLPLLQSAAGMFYNNYSLKKIPAIDFNLVTSASNFAINCYSLEACDVYNIGCSIAFTNTRLSRDELVKIFGNLKTVSGKTIEITGSAGAAALTPEDRAIATGKGWTITG
jgi:hypothetical protein